MQKENSATPKKRFFKGSIKNQLILVFSFSVLLITVGLISVVHQQQHDFLYQTEELRGKSFAKALANSSASWILTNDLAGLQEVMQGFLETPHLERAYIFSLQGKVLSSTLPQEIGLFATDTNNINLLTSKSPTTHFLLKSNQQLDIAEPVFVGKRHIGWVRVQMNMNHANQNLQSLLDTSVNFILLGAIVTFLIALFIANKLTNCLYDIISVVDLITKGKRNARITVVCRNELQLLANGVNQMLDVLTASEEQREQINRFYNAWMTSANIIVRTTDKTELLNKICEVLADQVLFKLAWIGFVQEDQSVSISASSDANSAYLKSLKISVNDTISEGKGATGTSIRENRPCIINNFMETEDTRPWQTRAKNIGIASSASFPLRHGTQTIGALCVYSAEVNRFDEELIALLSGLARDISYALENLEREQMRLITEQELRIAAVAFDVQEALMVTDARHNILRVNKAFTRITGYSEKEAVGQKANMLSSHCHDESFYKAMWQKIAQDRYWQGEIWNRKKNGEIFPEWLCITVISNEKGDTTHYVASFNDISQHKADEEKIKFLAYYDSLTRLPNRALLFERLNTALHNSQQNNHYGALMFLDLDNFKMLNDTLGHECGDQLLLQVSQRVMSCVRKMDMVARLGGDEFVVMLEGLGECAERAHNQAEIIAEKIRIHLSDVYLLKPIGQKREVEYHSSCSLGFVLFSGQEHGMDELLKRADLAMYQAKQAGRNTVTAFLPEMQNALTYKANLEVDLRQALEQKQLSLYYQAQVDVEGRVLGAEALLRWIHPERGFVSPADFIPLAEETGLILQIGDWVLQKGCEILAEWSTIPEMQHLKLAVNVSCQQLAQPYFVEQVKRTVLQTGINPALLKLEITESMMVNNIEDTIAKMHAIRALGPSSNQLSCAWLPSGFGITIW